MEWDWPYQDEPFGAQFRDASHEWIVWTREGGLFCVRVSVAPEACGELGGTPVGLSAEGRELEALLVHRGQSDSILRIEIVGMDPATKRRRSLFSTSTPVLGAIVSTVRDESGWFVFFEQTAGHLEMLRIALDDGDSWRARNPVRLMSDSSGESVPQVPALGDDTRIALGQVWWPFGFYLPDWRTAALMPIPGSSLEHLLGDDQRQRPWRLRAVFTLDRGYLATIVDLYEPRTALVLYDDKLRALRVTVVPASFGVLGTAPGQSRLMVTSRVGKRMIRQYEWSWRD